MVFAVALLLGFNANATIYYISAANGNDQRTPAEAQNISSPWLTIKHGIRQAASGDTLWVLPGIYPENDTITNKSLTLLGNGGSGTKPIINGGAVEAVILVLNARNVEIKNFQINVSQVFTQIGVKAERGSQGFTGLKVTDCDIMGAGTGGPCLVFNSYGMRFIGTEDSVTVSRCFVRPLSEVNCVFGRGIGSSGCRMYVGGETPADSNSFVSYYGIQTADPRGTWQVKHNKFFGIGMLWNAPNANSGTSIIANNHFRNVPPLAPFAALEIRSLALNGGRGLIVENNHFEGFTAYGIHAGRARNLIVRNNRFTPQTGALEFVAVGLNTKFQTSGVTIQPLMNDIQVYGNRFEGLDGNEAGGTGVEIANHYNQNNTGFNLIRVGGQADSANWFAPNLRNFVALDTNTRLSVTLPYWSGFPATRMRPANARVFAEGNLYGVATGLNIRPSEMTPAQLEALMAKIQDKTKADTLGFISVLPNQAIITPQSFIAPLTTRPSIARGVNAISAGGTVWLTTPSNFEFRDVVRANKKFMVRNLIGNSKIINSRAWLLTAGSDTIDLGDASLRVDSINFGGGVLWSNIATGNALTVSTLRGLTGGSDTSYISNISASRRVVFNNIESANDLDRTIPLGVNQGYAPVRIQAPGPIASGNLSAYATRVLTPSAYSPALPDTLTGHAGVNWVLSSNNTAAEATISVTHPAGTEVNAPLVNPTVFQNPRFGWVKEETTVGGNNTYTTGLTSLTGSLAVVDFPQLPFLSAGFNEPSLCIGSAADSLTVVAATSDQFNAGNTFTFELSDASGSFATPTNLGTVAGTSFTAVRLPAPVGLPLGSGYLLRVRSSNPAITAVSPSNLTIAPRPTAPVVTPSGVTTFCQGDSVILNGPAAAAGYLWSTGETTASIVVRSSSTVTLTVVSNEGCSSDASAPVTVTVNAAPDRPSVILSGSTNFCEGDSTLLEGPAGFATYAWSNGATTRNLTVRTGGEYSLVVTNAAGCQSEPSVPIEITVNPRPATPNLTSRNDTIFVTPTGADNYIWYFNGNRITNNQNIFVTRNNGTYTVEVIINGCRSLISAPFNYVYTSLSLATTTSFNVYPNPTEGLLNINNLAEEVSSLAILDAAGRVVISQATQGMSQVQVDLTGLAKGVYHLQATFQNGTVQRKKVVLN